MQYLSPRVRFALVHFRKPLDLALIGQVALATGQAEINLIGKTLDFNHPKIISRFKSWGVTDLQKNISKHTIKYEDLAELRKANPKTRLIGAVVIGGQNPFQFDWHDNDIIVIGGANGLSNEDIEAMDALITIPMREPISFMTASNVIASLTYHLLNR